MAIAERVTLAQPREAALGHKARQGAKAAVNALLLSSLLAALLVFACGSLPALLGLRTMVVTSGSMVPAIQTGDAVLIKRVTATSLAVGDVVTFGHLDGKGMVTHRIIALKEIQGRTYFQTQGDANPTPDANLTPAEGMNGKVAATLPKVGYLLYFSTTLWGKVLVVGLPLLILTSQEALALLRFRRTTPGLRPG